MTKQFHDTVLSADALEALLASNAEVLAVFTHRDDPTENIWFDSVAELAAARARMTRLLDGMADGRCLARLAEVGHLVVARLVCTPCRAFPALITGCRCSCPAVCRSGRRLPTDNCRSTRPAEPLRPPR